MTRFAKLAVAAAVATFVLIAVGGLVRATDSGLGCPDWPLCFGDWVPPADLHAWIEHTHRLIAAVFVGPLVGAVGLDHRLHRSPPRPAAPVRRGASPGCSSSSQSLLGAAVVLQGLAAELVTAHLAMALTVFAATIFIAERASNGPMPAAHLRPGLTPAAPIAAIAIFCQMLLGSWVTGHHAGLAFTDFPLMNGALAPTIAGSEQAIQLAHRAMSVVVAGPVLWTWITVRSATDAPLPRRLATLMLVLVALEIALGGLNVLSRLSALFVVPHLAVGAALFGLAAWLVLAGRRLRATELRPHSSVHREPGAVDTLRAYVALTKPRIIELLLVTTVPTMVLANGGLPSVWLVGAVVIGGTLAAGGANAINMFVDRDIDDIMRRTRHRPLPRHAVSPSRALAFGIGLSIVAFAFLALTVNLLAAVLAMSATAFYIFVYTMWLKRTTPHNIVIGGAAGCVPVLVAWAAVTGEVGLPALVLFGIVFYWTPPHFWALALRYRGDYEAAGVPMLPVVRGEAETARQIVLYTIVLVAVSLLLLPAAGMGLDLPRCGDRARRDVPVGRASAASRCGQRTGRHPPLPLLDQLPDAPLRRRRRRRGRCGCR